MAKKSKQGNVTPTLRKYSNALDDLIIKVMGLKVLFMRLEPLFCNPSHFNDAMKCIDNLKSTYEELKEYLENSERMANVGKESND